MLLIEHAIVTWLHLLAASIWVGGTLFIAMVLTPVLKQEMHDSVRLNIITKVGKRFNRVAIPAVTVLLSTGVYKALLVPSTLLYLTPYGTILAVKIAVVISMLIVWFIHARISNRINSNNNSSNSIEYGTTLRVRAKAIMLGKILAIQAVTVLFLAALLDSF